MKIRHRELTNGLIHGVAIPQERVIGLADCAPQTVFLEQRHHMVFIVSCRLKIEQKGLLAVIGEGRGRKERSLKTMRCAPLQGPSGRHVGLAGYLKVDGERIQKILDLGRRSQAGENFPLRGSQNRFQAFVVHGIQSITTGQAPWYDRSMVIS